MRAIAIGGLFVLLISVCGGLNAQEQANPYQKLLDRVAPSIVSVEIVVKYEFSYGGETNTSEQKIPAIGTILTPDGLVVVSAMGFSTETFRQMMGQMMGDTEQFQFKVSPQSFKVHLAGETKPLDAELIATDSKLGIGFLRIKDLGERTLTPAQFKEAPLSVGQELMIVTRMGKNFDYAPVVQKVLLGGTISKPRRAFVSGGLASTEPGALVYTMEGEAVGFTIFLPELFASDEGEAFSAFTMMFTRSLMSLASPSGFILPISELKPIMEQALQRKAPAPENQQKE